MRSFIHDGRVYKSLQEFCNVHQISYSKLRRLCRIYKKANNNPSVACDWVLGRTLLNHQSETKTRQYYQDREKARIRHERFIEKVENELVNGLIAF